MQVAVFLKCVKNFGILRWASVKCRSPYTCTTRGTFLARLAFLCFKHTLIYIVAPTPRDYRSRHQKRRGQILWILERHQVEGVRLHAQARTWR